MLLLQIFFSRFFLDTLASLDLKLSVSESVTHLFSMIDVIDVTDVNDVNI